MSLAFLSCLEKGDVCLVEVLSSITWSFATRGNNIPQDRGNSQTKTALILSLQNIRICHIRAPHHCLLHKSPESQYPRPCPNINLAQIQNAGLAPNINHSVTIPPNTTQTRARARQAEPYSNQLRNHKQTVSLFREIVLAPQEPLSPPTDLVLCTQSSLTSSGWVTVNP